MLFTAITRRLITRRDSLRVANAPIFAKLLAIIILPIPTAFSAIIAAFCIVLDLPNTLLISLITLFGYIYFRRLYVLILL
jgi:hypothetical protein